MRLRPLSEWECYARCYGQRGHESVRIVERRLPEPRAVLTGEAVRLLFEGRLDAAGRETEAEAA